ncbi:MAG: GNAT family N-acetyltransferase [Clostridium sp.]
MNKNIFLLKKVETKDIMQIWYDEITRGHNFIEISYWNKVYNIILEEYMESSETYVYKIKDTIVGFVSIKEREFIGALFIKEEFQGNGIGRELLDFIKTDNDRLLLRVYEKNKRAISFYEKNDFIQISIKERLDIKEREWLMFWKRR